MKLVAHLCLLAAALLAFANGASAKREPTRAIFFGGLGDVAAIGVADIAAKARGCGADVSTHAHGAWPGLVGDVRAAARKGRVVIAGHSQGGVSAIELAAAAGVPIALVVTFDPAASVRGKPGHVARALNLYWPGFPGGGVVHGAINRQIDARHMGYPSDPAVQRAALRAICGG